MKNLFLRSMGLILMTTIVMFSSCNKDKNENPQQNSDSIAGEWTVKKVKADNITFNGVNYREYLINQLELTEAQVLVFETGMNLTISQTKGKMTLLEDGTYTSDTFNEKTEGTWRLSDDKKILYLKKKDTETEVDLNVTSLTGSSLILEFDKDLGDFIKNLDAYASLLDLGIDENTIIKAKVTLSFTR